MLEIKNSFLEKGIAVMEFSIKHLMSQLGYTYEIHQKLQLSYLTKAYASTIQGAQHTGEVWAVYLK